MITENYVSFETAKLLKDKGFDEPIEMLIREDGTRYYADTNSVSRKRHVMLRNIEINMYSTDLSCPTLQMAMKWLREIHKIGVFPSTYTTTKGSDITHYYGTAIVDLNTYELMTWDSMQRDTYEDACEAAIKYCLENLI